MRNYTATVNRSNGKINIECEDWTFDTRLDCDLRDADAIQQATELIVRLEDDLLLSKTVSVKIVDHINREPIH